MYIVELLLLWQTKQKINLKISAGCWNIIVVAYINVNKFIEEKSQVKSSIHQFQNETDDVSSQKYEMLPEKVTFGWSDSSSV